MSADLGLHCLLRQTKINMVPLINPCPAELIKMPHPLLVFSQSDYFIQIVDINSQYFMANSVDPDQLASSSQLTWIYNAK